MARGKGFTAVAIIVVLVLFGLFPACKSVPPPKPAVVKAPPPAEYPPPLTPTPSLLTYEKDPRYARIDAVARQEIISNACGYAGLLRRHIIKEDRIFFPLVDRSLPADEQKKMAADFAQAEAETEAGVHEKYLALAGALEKELEG